MNWTFKNVKRLLSLAVFLFWNGVFFLAFDLILRDYRFLDIAFGVIPLSVGVFIMATIHRAGPPSDFHEHVDSQGREYA